jgi:hypothetical protein
MIMKEKFPTDSNNERLKNIITGVTAGGMLGVVFGYGFSQLWIGIIVGILVGLAIGYRLDRLPIRMRYPIHITRQFLLAAAFMMLAGFGYMIFIDRGWSGTRAILAALVPIAAWVFLVITLGMAIASLDELQRRIQTEAIAIGFAGTAIACGGYGLLQWAGIVPILNAGIILFVMILMWFIGKMWTLWRYQ